MRAKIASHITISAKLLVGVAVLSDRHHTSTTAPRDAGRCSDKPPVLRCRHDQRSSDSAPGDLCGGHRNGVARQTLGVLLRAPHVRHSTRTSQVAHSDHCLACHSRRGDSIGRLHLDSLVAPHTAKPPRRGGCHLNKLAKAELFSRRRRILPNSCASMLKSVS
jgi:hypothetical protein